jgi:hypothetical protein
MNHIRDFCIGLLPLMFYIMGDGIQGYRQSSRICEVKESMLTKVEIGISVAFVLFLVTVSVISKPIEPKQVAMGIGYVISTLSLVVIILLKIYG